MPTRFASLFFDFPLMTSVHRVESFQLSYFSTGECLGNLFYFLVQVCVITGDTGSGKSTQLAQMLYEAGINKSGVICVTQPRRIGAVSVSRRIAYEMVSRKA